jgi:hypothetical protein
LATAKFVTVIVVDPLFPSLSAVIVAVPGAIAVTTPDDEMVATALLLEVHVTGRPVTTFPAASKAVAVSVVVWPTDIDNGFGVTATEATAACVTVIVATSFFPSAVAVIDAVPGPVALTMPFGSTLATPVLLLDQMIARSVNGFWPASYATAVSCDCPPVLASM